MSDQPVPGLSAFPDWLQWKLSLSSKSSNSKDSTIVVCQLLMPWAKTSYLHLARLTSPISGVCWHFFFFPFSDSRSSWNKTRQCTETQGRVCSNPQTARKQQAPEEKGRSVSDKLPHSAWEDDNCPSKMGCYFQSPSATGVTYQVLLAGRESDRTNQHTIHSLIQ